MDDAISARFRQARPDVELTQYKDWPGTSTMLPFWDWSYRKVLDPVIRG